MIIPYAGDSFDRHWRLAFSGQAAQNGTDDIGSAFASDGLSYWIGVHKVATPAGGALSLLILRLKQTLVAVWHCSLALK